MIVPFRTSIVKVSSVFPLLMLYSTRAEGITEETFLKLWDNVAVTFDMLIVSFWGLKANNTIRIKPWSIKKLLLKFANLENVIGYDMWQSCHIKYNALTQLKLWHHDTPDNMTPCDKIVMLNAMNWHLTRLNKTQLINSTIVPSIHVSSSYCGNFCPNVCVFSKHRGRKRSKHWGVVIHIWR